MTTANEKKFLAELSELLKKYEISVEGYDDYDGAESYCGTNYYFVGKDIRIEIGEVEEKINAG